jgi:ATP-dependent Lhr-like helicase
LSNFHLLHPSLQHQIVNALGWREMRPFQDAVIPPLVSGEHRIVLAPTAGGKTEAAFFPTLSRMLTEKWTGLSVLYLCPIKALLNNLHSRLSRYCELVGRKCSLWHGDVGPSERKAILREAPDVLLTTPESLEAMLVSTRVDERVFFSGLRVVIIDEIHAFAGDDRGWHMLAVLERMERMAGKPLQRIGLSATVGNPDDLLQWLAGPCEGAKGVSLPPAPNPNAPPAPEPDVVIDHVGSLQNAAVVISRLHRGEKRLVFMDSRSKAEELGQALRQLGVTAFVTHSSLSQEQRRQAEDAFANRQDCVIVATSVLELGIDVGDLDRVIQIDSPSTVSSFLQRMGRTGRRAGTARNCLFLTVSESGLMQAAGLVELWKNGFVEPVTPPPMPEHVLAQQLMALVLQEGGIGRGVWFQWVRRVSGFAELGQEEPDRLVDSMLEKTILWDEAGILGIGEQGEREFGRRHFMSLLSVFLSAPLFTVLAGRKEIGSVDESSFLDGSGKTEAKVLLLGGSAWRVTHIDWTKRLVFVEPSDNQGKSRWRSQPPGLRFDLSQSIFQVLTDATERTWWSQRAKTALQVMRAEFSELRQGSTLLEHSRQGFTWWTFAGAGANASLAPVIAAATGLEPRVESFCIRFKGDSTTKTLSDAIDTARAMPMDQLRPTIDPNALQGLKFSSCLPGGRGERILEERLRDDRGIRYLKDSPVRIVAMG